MTKPIDVQAQQLGGNPFAAAPTVDPDFWVEQARRSIDGVANLWKSTLEYQAEMALQWKKLTLDLINSTKK